MRELKRNTEHLLEIPVAAQVETGSGLLLVALEAGLAASVDELFSFDAALVATGAAQAGELLDPVPAGGPQGGPRPRPTPWARCSPPTTRPGSC